MTVAAFVLPDWRDELIGRLEERLNELVDEYDVDTPSKALRGLDCVQHVLEDFSELLVMIDRARLTR